MAFIEIDVQKGSWGYEQQIINTDHIVWIGSGEGAETPIILVGGLSIVALHNYNKIKELIGILK